MKKLVVIAALLAFGYSNAQDTKSSDKKVTFGAKAGLNISMLNGHYSSGDTKSKIGFHLGGLAEIKLNPKFSIQPELLYSQEGGKYSYPITFTNPYSYNQDITLSKINLPILLKYYVIEGLSIDAGPQLDYIIKAKSDATVFLPIPLIVKYNTDMSDNSGIAEATQSDGTVNRGIINHDYGLKKLNFGVDIGAGYQVPSMGLFFQARYTLGLTKFTNNANFASGKLEGSSDPIDPTRAGTSFKNSNLQISVGYKF